MMSDNEDVQRTIDFNKLFARYRIPLIKLAVSYIQDEDMAEDFVNDAFATYWEKRSELDAGINVPAYIFVIVKHKCLTHLKRLQKELEIKANLKSIEEWELNFQISSLESCDPDEMFSNEVQQLVTDALHSLPEKTRQIFMMSRFDMLSNREIATELNVSVKTVEYHITQALKVMRIALKDYLAIFLLFFLK